MEMMDAGRATAMVSGWCEVDGLSWSIGLPIRRQAC